MMLFTDAKTARPQEEGSSRKEWTQVFTFACIILSSKFYPSSFVVLLFMLYVVDAVSAFKKLILKCIGFTMCKDDILVVHSGLD